MKLHRALAAVDYSEPARVGFDRALAVSRLHDAELVVVHAVPSERPFRWHAKERIALIGSLRDAAQAANVRFGVSVQHGDPAGVILLHADARRADLIGGRASGQRSTAFVMVPSPNRWLAKRNSLCWSCRRLPRSRTTGRCRTTTFWLPSTSGKARRRPSKERRLAAEADADLILVGVTARGAFGRIFASSTAARVIRTAGRAVLAIPELRRNDPVAGDSEADPLAAAA